MKFEMINVLFNNLSGGGTFEFLNDKTFYSKFTGQKITRNLQF